MLAGLGLPGTCMLGQGGWLAGFGCVDMCLDQVAVLCCDKLSELRNVAAAWWTRAFSMFRQNNEESL